MNTDGKGGYDDGYRCCPCFWGTSPGSLVKSLFERRSSWSGCEVLDAGCGEGKNAVFSASHRVNVHAFDISEIAIRNARQQWGNDSGVAFNVADVRDIKIEMCAFDVIIAYGLLHCLDNQETIMALIDRIQCGTKLGGHNIVCLSMTDRTIFCPSGVSPTYYHSRYVSRYAGWNILQATDSDLHQGHRTTEFRIGTR